MTSSHCFADLAHVLCRPPKPWCPWATFSGFQPALQAMPGVNGAVLGNKLPPWPRQGCSVLEFLGKLWALSVSGARGSAWSSQRGHREEILHRAGSNSSPRANFSLISTSPPPQTTPPPRHDPGARLVLFHYSSLALGSFNNTAFVNLDVIPFRN